MEMTMKETFDITGMTCAACSARVGKAAGECAGVTEANVNLLKNSMELTYDGSPKTIDAVVAAIEKAGYGAIRARGAQAPAIRRVEAPARHGRRQQPSRRSAASSSSRRSSRCRSSTWPWAPCSAGRSRPRLTGMEGMMAAALTQLLLCLPILFVNRHYFVTGFKSLWHRAPNMDSLIALGSTASAVWSIVGLYRMALGVGRHGHGGRARGAAQPLL